MLNQGSSTFFSPRTPWLRETLSREPHPRRPKFGPDIHIIDLELSVSHTQTLPYTCLNRITNHHHTNYKSQSFYLQADAYRIEIPPASHFGRQITKKLKAERSLTHRCIHLIVVQNNLPSGVLRLVVPSHQLPIHRAGIGMLFSFFT